ncbi:MAG: cysteine desulfurase [Pirellulaceae bacterium]|nr:MAG: cysteine desulfurase [Pirellulaceae bacterium]
MNEIYLDNNATTFLDPWVAEEMTAALRLPLGNPASQHAAGRRAWRILEDARARILRDIDAPPGSQVVFTSGGTEANNLAIRGLYAQRQRPRLLIGATEHPSVLDAAVAVAGGEKVTLLPVHRNGLIDLDFLEDQLKRSASQIAAVSVMLANNETGIVQDLQPIASLCHEHGVPFHSDIIQGAGKIPFSMRATGIAAVTITAHKIHGPVGIGALVVAPSLALSPLLHGGGQQLGLRPGTEPVVLAAALANSLQATCRAREEGRYEQTRQLREEFEQRLLQLGNVEVIGHAAPRLPHTSNVSFLGLDRQALVMRLDLLGLACSTGSACASGSARPSRVLSAMGLPAEVIAGSIRFSLSRFSEASQIVQAVDRITQAVERLPSSRALN